MYFICIYKICWMKETFQEYVDPDIDRDEALDQCYSLFSGFIFCIVWLGPRICFMELLQGQDMHVSPTLCEK